MITEHGGQILVVLQSGPKHLAEQMTEDHLPFEILCDPAQKLYEKFEIAPALSKEELLGGRSMEKITAARAAGFSHGEYEGE